jgi:hypothetical protein
VPHEKTWRRKFEMQKYDEDIALNIDRKIMGEVPNKEYEDKICAYKVDQAQERRIPNEEHAKSVDLDNILQIKCPIVNKWKMKKENSKEEDQETFIAQNSNVDELSYTDSLVGLRDEELEYFSTLI